MKTQKNTEKQKKHMETHENTCKLRKTQKNTEKYMKTHENRKYT